MCKVKPAGLKFAIIDRAFKHRMDEKVKILGLTGVQLRVLTDISALEESGVDEINQCDLEKIQKVTHSAMTGIIKRLENKGYIICSTSNKDKRYKKINCTPKFKKIHRDIRVLDDEVWADISSCLDAKSKECFMTIMDTIIKNINN